MAVTINASTSTGLVSTADTSGIIKLQSNGKNTNALAWVSFNGTSGSAVISSSYNISSITYVAAGNYTMNFTNAMADINYCAVFSAQPTVNAGGSATFAISPLTTSVSAQNYEVGTLRNTSFGNLVVFGN